VVPSAFLRERVVALGVDSRTVHVIPAGVDTAFFSLTTVPDGPPTVVFIGRFVEKKGLDVLAAAWPVVAAAVPDVRLRLLGDGPLRDVVEQLARQRAVEWILPDASRRATQVREVIASATVVTTPSRTASDGDAESLLLVNLEAQASGRPVVTTDHGGISEFVRHNETALVVPARNATALADALVALLRDPARSAAMGAAGAAFAARFDASAMAARVDDLYDEVLSRSTK
jgi:glycosyltransferase involved in cell wall biosynthesis